MTPSNIKKQSEGPDISPLPWLLQELGKAMQFLFDFPTLGKPEGRTKRRQSCILVCIHLPSSETASQGAHMHIVQTD